MVEDYKFKVTASAGVAVYPMDDNDLAMYEAKMKDKNKYALYRYDN